MIVIFSHLYFSKEYYKREKANIISAQFSQPLRDDLKRRLKQRRLEKLYARNTTKMTS